jgi:hypothetical protein
MFQRIVMPSSAGSGILIKHNSSTKIATSFESILAYRNENLKIQTGQDSILYCLVSILAQKPVI